MRKTIPLCLLAFLSLAACDVPLSEHTDASAVMEEPRPPDETVYEETIVELQADGTTRVTRRPITAGEERRQNEERMRVRDTGIAAIVQDGSCAYNAIWIYDQTNLSGNRICFVGTGTAWLSQYVRYWWGWLPISWEISYGTYWPGDRGGVLRVRSNSPLVPPPIVYWAWDTYHPFNVSPNVVEALTQY